MIPIFKEPSLSTVYKHILIPGSNALSEVEANGVLFDREKALHVKAQEIMPEVVKCITAAQKATGRQDINLGSNQQCAKYLYDEIGLPDFKVNKKVRSVDKASRKKLLQQKFVDKETRAFLEALAGYRTWKLISSTFIDSSVAKVDFDGRLRCSFQLIGTETGRLSAKSPNLQNQPRGKLIRQLYVAPPGSVIMNADYSQAELRVASVLSGDQTMQQIYRDGRDFHAETSTSHFGDAEYQHRNIAKNINFGILYGQTAKAFHEMYDIPLGQASQYMDAWWRLFPGVAEWVANTKAEAIGCGSVRTPTGRLRRFHLFTNENREHLLRAAVNTIMQATASDMTLWSLIELVKRGYNVVLTVHDSIVLEVLRANLESTAREVKRIMESAPRIMFGWDQIPFQADISVGPSWGECE